MQRTMRRPMAECRKEPRYVAEIESRIIWDGMSEPVIIRNISAFGALLQGRSFPPINTCVTLISDGLEICGTVIWNGVDQCGLLLTQEVEPLVILRNRPVRTTDAAFAPSITLHRIGTATYG